MALETLKLPFINFSKLSEVKPGSPEWNSLKIEVRRAMDLYGCFEASFDKVPLQLRKEIFDVSMDFFNLPDETKVRCSSEKTSIAYNGRNYPSLSPLYESVGIQDANVLEEVQSFTQILWPQGNPNFSKTVASYAQQLSELDQMIRHMLAEGLGIGKYFDEHLESTKYVLFLNKYEAPETGEAQRALKSHRDQNTLTVLFQNHVNGFQLQTKDGQWFDVKPSPDAFLVILGESFSAWINGRIEPPVHRVVMSSGNDVRQSVGLFSYPKPGFKVIPQKEFIDEEHPGIFKSFDHAEYDEFLLTTIARDDLDLKTYAGVKN